MERAVDAAGGQSAFARFVGVSQPTVWAWLKQSRPLPAEFVLKTEASYGISRHESSDAELARIAGLATRHQAAWRVRKLAEAGAIRTRRIDDGPDAG